MSFKDSFDSARNRAAAVRTRGQEILQQTDKNVADTIRRAREVAAPYMDAAKTKVVEGYTNMQFKTAGSRMRQYGITQTLDLDDDHSLALQVALTAAFIEPALRTGSKMRRRFASSAHVTLQADEKPQEDMPTVADGIFNLLSQKGKIDPQTRSRVEPLVGQYSSLANGLTSIFHEEGIAVAQNRPFNTRRAVGNVLINFLNTPQS